MVTEFSLGTSHRASQEAVGVSGLYRASMDTRLSMFSARSSPGYLLQEKSELSTCWTLSVTMVISRQTAFCKDIAPLRVVYWHWQEGMSRCRSDDKKGAVEEGKGMHSPPPSLHSRAGQPVARQETWRSLQSANTSLDNTSPHWEAAETLIAFA